MTFDPQDLIGLPHGIRQRSLQGINGLTVNVLEVGFEPPGRPAVLLLHGFPDIAYSSQNDAFGRH